jgi:CheY-like chemotaxis protein
MKNILVVDDNQDMLTTMSYLLKALGHNVATAADGESALAMFMQFAPDVVLLDLGMPRMSGIEIARRMRDLSTNGRAKIVAVSGYSQGQTDAPPVLFDDFLLKPATLDQLKSAIGE